MSEETKETTTETQESVDFKPITSQEELNNLIKSRLERNSAKITEEIEAKYSGYVSAETQAEISKQLEELQAKLQEKESAIADLTAKATKYETDSVRTRIAAKYNLPIELADRLTGETEEELKADAEKLSQFIGTKKQTVPLFIGEQPAKETTKEQALKKTLEKLKGND